MKQILTFFCMALFATVAVHANPALIGNWKADVDGNRSFDIRLAFSENGRCTVKITDDKDMQETVGNWSYDGSLFRLNATFRNAAVSYVRGLQWSSVLNMSADGNSFNILGIAEAGGRQTRITFFRHDGEDDAMPETFNERAIPQIFAAFSLRIPARASIAIVGIDPAGENEAVFYVNELTRHFVNTRNYTVLERRSIEAVFDENNFQLSGLVDDDAIVSIGKFMGATVVITGSIDIAGTQKRLTIKAIDVLTSELISIQTVTL